VLVWNHGTMEPWNHGTMKPCSLPFCPSLRLSSFLSLSPLCVSSLSLAFPLPDPATGNLGSGNSSASGSGEARLTTVSGSFRVEDHARRESAFTRIVIGTGRATYWYGASHQKRSGGMVSSRRRKCRRRIPPQTVPLPALGLQPWYLRKDESYCNFDVETSSRNDCIVSCFVLHVCSNTESRNVQLVLNNLERSSHTSHCVIPHSALCDPTQCPV